MKANVTDLELVMHKTQPLRSGLTDETFIHCTAKIRTGDGAGW